MIGFCGYPQYQPFRQASGQASRAPGATLPNGNTGGGDYMGGGGSSTGSGGPGASLPNGNTGGGDYVGSGPFTPPTGPPVGPPNGDSGGGDYVGSPIGDSLYILFLLIFGYGMYRRKQRINEE